MSNAVALIPRTLFSEEHEIFRRSVRGFLERECAPHHARWEAQGMVDREAWQAAGREGLLCMSIASAYGGLGVGKLFSAILIEELTKLSLSGLAFHIHSEIVAPYIEIYGTEAQKQAWLPKMATGEAIGAIAMTEPSGGSDLQAMRTTARRDGDDFILSGQKTFISNGQLADVVIVAAKTDPTLGAKGVTLFLVDGKAKGFERGRNLKKLGFHAQDTSELFFDEVRLPASSILGQEGQGFYALMQQLAWERMLVAIRATAMCEAALGWTADYTRGRNAFGKPLLDKQYIRFRLADLKAQTLLARVFVDRCLELVLKGELTAEVAAVAKLQTTELQTRLLDECLQFHGGAGYMWEYPICRAYADTRYMRIAGGSNEVMRELIGRTL
ncbi:MAG TPA: acyl-CoA dehydrogenase family protein [Caulobacteraceae bacterium]|nr:acyl-CoA dehydrogenase family protein [Caulobacteraceae bacterium]